MMCPESQTSDGFELQFGTNHVGHFALFHALKSALHSSATQEYSSRVVMLTSAGHRLAHFNLDDYNLNKSYDPFVAYAQAKTANIHMSTEIERRYGSANLHANAVHPGMIDTGIDRHLDVETAKASANFPGAKQVTKSHGQGAATTILAAIAKELKSKVATTWRIAKYRRKPLRLTK
jgi:NAD(P)-dependent dehydrogenase (short-subunit alcohol dehydrogenase family)